MTNASGRKQTILGSESFRCSASKQCLVSQQYLNHFASLALLSLPLPFLPSLPPSFHSPDASVLNCTQLFGLLNHWSSGCLAVSVCGRQV